MKDLKTRIMDKVIVQRNGCWNSTRVNNGKGYTTISINNKMVLTHRASYLAFIGEIPNGLFILHKCDNPLCVNPDHLFLGTNINNMADCKAKNRSNAGVKNGRVLLTENDVLKILKDERSTREIAKEYKISKSTVFDIKHKFTWKHLNP